MENAFQTQESRWDENLARIPGGTVIPFPNQADSDIEDDAAMAFLLDPDLLDHVIADTDQLGYAGEADNKKFLYLQLASRKLDKPLSSMVKSSSGAGKSGLVKVMMTLLPPEELQSMTNFSDKALFHYGRTELRHKVVYIAETPGIEKHQYELRPLLDGEALRRSRACKISETGFSNQMDVVEGPISLVLTATKDLDPEVENRLIILTLDESAEQTKRILQAETRRTSLEWFETDSQRADIIKKHRRAQALLRSLAVIIPYADSIQFPHQWVVSRRYSTHFMQMIKAAALLRQYQKTIMHSQDGRHYIEADLHDYTIAYQLACSILSQNISTIPPRARTLHSRIVEMLKSGGNMCGCFTRKDLRKQTGLGERDIAEYTKCLCSSGVLEKTVKAHGELEYRLVYADLTGFSLQGLTSPDELRAAMRVAENIQM